MRSLILVGSQYIELPASLESREYRIPDTNRVPLCDVAGLLCEISMQRENLMLCEITMQCKNTMPCDRLTPVPLWRSSR